MSHFYTNWDTLCKYCITLAGHNIFIVIHYFIIKYWCSNKFVINIFFKLIFICLARLLVPAHSPRQLKPSSSPSSSSAHPLCPLHIAANLSLSFRYAANLSLSFQCHCLRLQNGQPSQHLKYKRRNISICWLYHSICNCSYWAASSRNSEE